MADGAYDDVGAPPSALSTATAVAYGTAQARWILVTTIFGSGLAQLDGSVVNVALPRIGTNLHAGLTSLQWTLNAYTLTLSGLLLLGGSLGDRMGRRRIFVVGVIAFTIASAGCAAAPTVGTLVAMRAVQGVGAALLMPGSLAILQAVFRPADRAAAVGAWSGIGGVATAFGPVLGGFLVGVAPWGWRLVFLINIPIAVFVVALAQRFVPETRDAETRGGVDVVGAVLASAGLAGVVYGLTEGPAHGWGARPMSAVALGAVLLVAFVAVQGRRAAPLLPLGLFGNRQFSATNAVTLLVYAALSGGVFLLPVALQRVCGFSPIEAGSALLPITAIMLVLSAWMGRLATRIGPRIPMSVGPIVAGAGIAGFATLGRGSTYLTGVLPPMIVFGLGLATTVAPLTATALAAAPDHNAGVASAVNNDIARIGGLLAVAVLPGLAGLTPAAYADPARLATGFHHAVLIAGALCASGGVLAALTIRSERVNLDDGPAA